MPPAPATIAAPPMTKSVASWSPAVPPPPSYRVLSIVALVLSLGTLGRPARRYSRQVGQRYGAGDMTGAREAAGKARTWGIVGTIPATST